MTRALLLDLDDTLYDYAPAESAARARVLTRVAEDLGRPADEVERAWASARKTVKARLGNTGAAHARLMYLAELAGRLRGGVDRVRGWERLYWTTFLGQATLRPGARPLLERWRAAGHKVAIVTDLTLETQLWKLEAFDLFGLVDAVVASEEVGIEKPALAPFELALQRLGLDTTGAVVIGDSVKKDGGGAAALGVPYFQARSSETGEGLALDVIAERLGV